MPDVIDLNNNLLYIQHLYISRYQKNVKNIICNIQIYFK